MLDSITDRVAERIEDNLSNDEEECSESQVTQWPSFLQCVDDKNDLHDEVYEQFDRGDEVEYDEKSQSLRRSHASPWFECSKRDQESNNKHTNRGRSKEPDWHERSVFV